MNIILAGMPGCGKTTVAEVFEKRGATVLDTDALIVARYGQINSIFAEHGEEYFRNAETQAVKDVCGLDGVVIATGGGCLLRSENVRLLKTNGKIVYLKTGVETLLKRVEGNTDRPLLAVQTRARLEKLLSERRSVYESAADITVETDGLTPQAVADKITESLK